MDAQGDVPASAEAQAPKAQDDGDVLTAPLALESLERVQMEQIDNGPVDFVLKCTEGLFAGRFIYVNRTAQGELFGSDRGSKDITMYIENANLSPKHTEIKFNDQTYQYFLRDFGSTDGTWVRIRWNRSIEVAPGQVLKVGDTLVEIREGPPIPREEEVVRWLAVYQLEHLASRLNARGLRSLEDLRAQPDIADVLAADHAAVASVAAEDLVSLRAALGELGRMWPAGGYPSRMLELVPTPPWDDGRAPTSIGWGGGTVALAPNGEAEDEFGGGEPDDEAATAAARPPKDVTVGVVPVTGWQTCEWLRVGYSFGRYYVHLSERSAESAQKCWVRLLDDQRHWLQPQDIFCIGSLEFQVMRFNTAVCSSQGYRATMEDEEILVQDLATSNWRHCSFFGVYDGHGGRDCVSFVRERLHMNFVAALHAKGGLDKSSQVHHDILDGLAQGFRDTDQQFLSMARERAGVNGGSGCAAVVVCIVGAWVWCANAGDSRAVLCRNGRAVQLSLDHKPDRPDEAQRIEAAGGFVSFRRVLGRLAVSRAFGDEDYKVVASLSGQLVTAEPEIRVEQLTPQDEFLFMACDGLFDVFTSQEAVDFIHARLAAMPSNEQDPQLAVHDIVHEAIHKRNSRDNVTALLVTFKRAVLPHR